jgi:hypothetical protein
MSDLQTVNISVDFWMELDNSLRLTELLEVLEAEETVQPEAALNFCLVEETQ